MKYLRFFLFFFLLLLAMVGYGYYYHISQEKHLSQIYHNIQYSIEPKLACSVYNIYNLNFIHYADVGNGLYECGHTIKENYIDNQSNLIFTARGDLKGVKNIEIHLSLVDKKFTTKETDQEKNFNSKKLKEFAEIVSLVNSFYGNNTNNNFEYFSKKDAKTDTYNYENYSLELRKIYIKGYSNHITQYSAFFANK